MDATPGGRRRQCRTAVANLLWFSYFREVTGFGVASTQPE